MSLTVLSNVYAGGGTLIIYNGTADRSVVWRLTGSGTLTTITNYTDHNGNAAARYTPGTVGETVTIEIESGA